MSFKAGLLYRGVPLLLALLLTQAPRAASVEDDRKTVPEPQERHVAAVYDNFKSAIAKPALKTANIPGQVAKIKRSPKEAENVSELDEISDSSWFTNRNFWSPIPADKFGEGPARSDHAPGAGSWTVTKCKTDGVMPGFQIRDQKGDSYLLKFDPPDNLEMATAADVISSKFLYGAGYNVPENFIVTFDEQLLVLKNNLVCKGSKGKLSSNSAEISELLKTIPRTTSGQLRAMASRLIDGRIKGPFSYSGVRKDDLNDHIPHEHRRELRGLRMIQAFLNNPDVKQLNTLDSYVEEDGQQFLKHYLIDFGDSLGSFSFRAKNAGDGYQYFFDPVQIMKTTLTFGMNRRRSSSGQTEHPSIGYIEGVTFEPMQWRSNWPNPAFDQMTNRDGYWAAKIVASFTHEQIAAAVRSGQYTDPDAEWTLVQILEQRRDRLADYWFHRVAPLDRFRFTSEGLTFVDLAIEANLDNAANVNYGVVMEGVNTTNVFQGGPKTAIPMTISDAPVKVQIRRLSSGRPPLTVDVIVRRVEDKPTVIAIQR